MDNNELNIIANGDVDRRNYSELTQALQNADSILNKSYLSLLNTSNVNIIQKDVINLTRTDTLDLFNKNIRFFEITKIVINKNENVREKLISIFNAIGKVGASILMLITSKDNKISIKFGVKVEDNEDIGISSELLNSALKGNFPGSHFKKLLKSDLDNLYNNFPNNSYVSAVSTIAGKRSKESENKEHLYIQGIEKVIDTLQGENYDLLLIADPISQNNINVSRKTLENLCTQLTPFSDVQLSIGTNKNNTINSSVSEGFTKSINESISLNTSHTVGTSKTITNTTSESHTEGRDGTLGGLKKGAIVGGIGGAITPIGALFGGIGGSLIGAAIGKLSGVNHSDTKGTSHSVAEGSNESNTQGETRTKGTSESTSETKTHGESQSEGSSSNLQVKYQDFTISQLIERIKDNLKRYDECADIGMWNCAMYCISDYSNISQTAASVYYSLMRGEKSSLENGTIINWDKTTSDKVLNYLKFMEHPRFDLGNIEVTPGTLISSAELAMEASLPNTSVPNISVVDCAKFGRNISTYDDNTCNDNLYAVKLGTIYHMYQEEDSIVTLNPNSMTSHLFITGSTGSGKSNTVYNIISECIRIGKKFLIIEPAKGEYKNIFGQQANVYGTNPNLTNLLRINPFSFPKEIHVLEHLDRLIEIFNVCWPMYAAMPAVLKDAVEKSYVDAGWDLTLSENKFGDNYYPTFKDVMRNIKYIIEESDYDNDNKGAYKGSLITRLKSLCNGINGLIFSSDEITNQELFDENTIIDLSRVGSSETKSLIMGLLILKLQEYRMTQSEMNSSFKHMTVLEEAHNLLKKTSSEQSQDGNNLAGKSVEMLSNAIAEMRTYGESFVIADQAPGLLDRAVIRNTNTKIIMRLPDEEDRKLVGKSANLNDDQINELARLPLGVGAIYQNEWIEPVLCKIYKADISEKSYKVDKLITKNEKQNDYIEEKINIIEMLCDGKALDNPDEVSKIKLVLDELKLAASYKVFILNSLKYPYDYPRYTMIAPIVCSLLPDLREAFMYIYQRTSEPKQWSLSLNEIIQKQIGHINDQTRNDIIQCVITDYLNNELGKPEIVTEWMENGGVL